MESTGGIECEWTVGERNDGSVAGLVWHDKKCMGIQYHPEAGPGPHDADVNFAPFVQWMAEARVRQGAGVSW